MVININIDIVPYSINQALKLFESEMNNDGDYRIAQHAGLAVVI